MKLINFIKIFVFTFLVITLAGAYSSTKTDVFILTSSTPHIQLIEGSSFTIEYLVKNNQPIALEDNGFIGLPAGITHVPDGNPSSCEKIFSLGPKNSATDQCTAQLVVDSTAMVGTPPFTYEGGPKVCHTYTNNIQCSQPGSPEQTLNVEIVPQNSPLSPVLEFIFPNPDPCEGTTCYLVNQISPTLTVAIHNTSLTEPALDVTVSAGTLHVGVSPTNCGNIAPNSSCNVTFTYEGTQADGHVQVSSLNTAPISFDLNLIAVGVSVNNLNFTHPDTQNLILTNVTPFPVNVSSITLPGVTNVTPPTSSCNISAGIHQTCQVPYTATHNAYGIGNSHVTYSYGGGGPGGSFTVDGSVAVSPTSATINDGTPITFDYVDASENIIIANTGNFDLQALSMTLTAVPPLNLTLANGTCGATLLAGQSCTAQLVNTGLTEADTGKTLHYNVMGTNLLPNPTTKNVGIVGIAIAPAINSPRLVGGVGRHMQYQAIGVANTFDTSQTLDTLTVTHTGNLNGKIKSCAPADTDCDGYNQPGVGQAPICYAGITLAPNSICIIWLKALDDQNGLSSVPLNSASVTVTATSLVNGVEKTFTETYSTGHAVSVFAGGIFPSVPTLTGTQYAMRWAGGTNWIDMNTTGFQKSGTTGNTTVNAITIYKGDLFIGGIFTIPSVQSAIVSRWDSNAWNRVGFANGNNLPFSNASGQLRIDSFTVTKDGSGNDQFLYGAGRFSTLADSASTTIPAAFTAEWDGQSWTPLPVNSANQLSSVLISGLPVNETFVSTFYNNMFCAGATTSTFLNAVECFNGSNWNTLVSGSFTGVFSDAGNNPLRKLLGTPSTAYLRGNFTNTLPGFSPASAGNANGFAQYTGAGGWVPFRDNKCRFIQSANTTMLFSADGNTIYSGVNTTTTGWTNINPYNGCSATNPGAVTVNNIAQITLSPLGQWSTLPDTNPTFVGLKPPSAVAPNNFVLVNSMAIGYDSPGNKTRLYVGGVFTQAGANTNAVNFTYWSAPPVGPKWATSAPTTNSSGTYVSGAPVSLFVGPSMCLVDPNTAVTQCANF